MARAMFNFVQHWTIRKMESTQIPDYLQAIRNFETEIANHRQNIKDLRKAIRHSGPDDRRMYRNVIKWNRRNLRDARVKIRIIRASNERSWWLWLFVIVVCIALWVIFPAAPVAVILSPIWLALLIGFFSIIQMTKR
jgi:ABC-type siderophore export system fused ATPase/permease subunit